MKSIIFDILKDLLPILSGVLGLLGVLNVFKTVHGKLTIWGWFAVILISLSTIGGIFLAKKEKSDSEREKQQLQNKLNRILSDLAKVKQPLGEVELAYWTVLPDSEPEVKAYKEYIKEKIAALPKLKKAGFRPLLNKEIESLVLDGNGNPSIYDINNKSAYWPNEKFPALQSLSKTYSVKLCISLKKIKPEEYQPFVFSSGSVDWCASSVLTPVNIIFYDVKKDKIGYRTKNKYDKGFVRSNGKISSVQDLFGARVFFQPPSLGRSYVKNSLRKNGAPKDVIERHDRVTSILAALQTQGALIDTGTGQSFSIDSKDIKKYTNIDMNTFFYSTLPLNDGEEPGSSSKEE
ncbi:hypothetical protein [Kosakonia sp. YIM B13611]|uniref:hypothetical protein n=1 Tax=unclassified Kosakonia TaxID=2632876 RepID=UPI003678ED79